MLKFVSAVIFCAHLLCQIDIANAQTGDSASTWSCAANTESSVRLQKVRRGFLPTTVIDGETKTTTVQKRLQHFSTPALSVAVIRNGQLDWTAAWGQLYSGGPKVQCNSLFQAGSIAKPVTVLAALRMQTQHKIDWDKNIDEYLRSYQLPAGKQSEQNPVTFRNLFSHTAGITPGGYWGYEQGVQLPSDQQTVLALPPSNAKKVEVLTTPNAQLRYSGGGYTVAEIALQDFFAQPFNELMREWILDPVGMKQATFTQPLPASLHDLAARGHNEKGQVVPGGWHNHPEQAAAGLWATASDLAELLVELRRAYLGQSKLFSKDTVRELFAQRIEGHAYGFRLVSEGDQEFIVHYGGTVGYNAGMAINLDSGNGAVYLSNSQNGGAIGQEFFAAVSRQYSWTTFREDHVKRATIDAATLSSFAGRYEFREQQWAVNIEYDNRELTIVFPNGDRYVLTSIEGENASFVHLDTSVRARFIPTENGVQLALYGQVGERVTSIN